VIFCVYLVDIAFYHHCKHTYILQVVPQSLGGGNIVDSGQTHDDLVHEGGVFDAVKSVHPAW